MERKFSGFCLKFYQQCIFLRFGADLRFSEPILGWSISARFWKLINGSHGLVLCMITNNLFFALSLLVAFSLTMYFSSSVTDIPSSSEYLPNIPRDASLTLNDIGTPPIYAPAAFQETM